MDDLFERLKMFNEPIGSWDVSNVTSMSMMFQGCEAFNQPLDKWNVSKVTSMRVMFKGCVAFNQSLDQWNVSRELESLHMIDMFEDCGIDIKNWHTWYSYYFE